MHGDSPDQDYFRFRLGPDLSINIGVRVKKPGVKMGSIPVELSAVAQPRHDEVDAYERLLTDAIHGDSLLFVREDAVEAAWAIVEPVLGNVIPICAYAPGTWGPHEIDTLVAGLGKWHNPAKPQEVRPRAA
jgi:glucose-6-phosphate 1-dehydrogenase